MFDCYHHHHHFLFFGSFSCVHLISNASNVFRNISFNYMCVFVFQVRCPMSSLSSSLLMLMVPEIDFVISWISFTVDRSTRGYHNDDDDLVIVVVTNLFSICLFLDQCM